MLIKEITEGFSPSTFLKVGKRLIELQDRWVYKNDVKYQLWDVFADGRGLGQIAKKAEGKNYQAYDQKFDSLDNAIGFLISKNARHDKVVWTTGDIL